MNVEDWWTISALSFLEALHRCANGEDPDFVYAEMHLKAILDELIAEGDEDNG